MNECLNCKQTENNCKCEGGFKIIYLFGIPMSKIELDSFNKKSKLEKKIQETTFMGNKIKEINEKADNDLKNIIKNINSIKY